MITLLQLEHALAIATELDREHWPSWLVSVAKRVASGDAWVDRSTTYLALVCVGEPTPRHSKRHAMRVLAAQPLREAILAGLTSSQG